ncbi:AI-2E family transporter [Streptacidiphilus sp. P02-A3a]|uniref:AI-2E family transporter n=1 Tax=Streptacidiphilus sp. P02-A3a TaxID=2704468 RepID=UPI001CDD1DAE|nr:AI-2E family transporter [Streptacidiphilus sp. P02-A3a]
MTVHESSESRERSTGSAGSSSGTGGADAEQRAVNGDDVLRLPLPRSAGQPPQPPRPSRSWFSIGFQLSLGAVLAYLLIQSVQSIASILMLVLLALVTAISVDPFVRVLTRTGMPRSWAVTSVLLGLVLVVGGLSLLFVTPITNEVNALIRNVPVWLQQLHDHHSALGRLEDKYHVIENAKKEIGSGGGSTLVSGLMGAGQLVLSTLTGTFLVVTLTMYFLAGLPGLKSFFLRFVAGSRREHTARLTDEILLRTGRYMLANVATSVIAGVATFVWLEAFGVPYPAALGVFVAVMDLIPLVGSTIGGIVVSLVALVVSWPVAIATAAFYTVFRFAEDYLITPKAMKYAVEVHPLVTILGVVIGGELLGLIGALLAIPVAVAVDLILDDAVFPSIDAR